MNKLLLFFGLFLTHTFAQNSVQMSGTVIDALTKAPIQAATVINKSKNSVAVTSSVGQFILNASVNDTLVITHLSFQNQQVQLKNNNIVIALDQKTNQLDEVLVSTLKLTGYFEIDTKRIKVNDNYRYVIAGLNLGYEPGKKSPNAFQNIVNSLSNPVDLVYNLFNKKNKELKQLLLIKTDENFKKLLATQTNRQSILMILQMQKSEINTILENCNYSKTFIDTASDLQVLDAIASSYQDYQVFKNNK